MADHLLTNQPRDFRAKGTSTNNTYYDQNYARHSNIIGRFNSPIFDVPYTAETWIQFGLYISDTHHSPNGFALAVKYDTGEMWLGWRPDEDLLYYRDTPGASLSTKTWVPTVASFIWVDMKIVLDDGSGNATYEFYEDGVLVVSHTTALGANSLEPKLIFGTNDWTREEDDWHITNLRISDTDTRGKRFREAYINAAGNYDEWAGRGIEGMFESEDLRFSWPTATGQRMSGTVDFADLTDNGAPTEVRLQSIARHTGPTPAIDEFRHFVRDGTTDYDQAVITPDGSRDRRVTAMATNPATGVAWTHADLDGMEFGVLSA